MSSSIGLYMVKFHPNLAGMGEMTEIERVHSAVLYLLICVCVDRRGLIL